MVLDLCNATIIARYVVAKISSCDLRFVAWTLEAYNLQTIPSEAKTRNETNLLGSYMVHDLYLSKGPFGKEKDAPG